MASVVMPNAAATVELDLIAGAVVRRVGSMRRISVSMLAIVLVAGCGVDQAESSERDEVTITLPAFAPTPAGWLCPYPGRPGDRVLELRAEVRCRAPSEAIMLCAHETDPQADANHATLEECTWTACAAGDVVELVTPSSFVQGDRSRISVLVDSTTSAIGDYDVIFVEARVQPGVTGW